jgi:uncharacterized protein (DUF58 family)
MTRPTLLPRLFSSRAWRPPRTLKVTRVGRTYLVLTLGIGLAALNTGNNLLYLVLGFLLALIVLSGVLSERVLRDLEVRRLLPEGVFAQESFHLRYEVRRTRGQAFAVRLQESAEGLVGWAWVPHVVVGSPVVVRADLTAARRGPLRLAELVVSTSFPFGLFEKARRLELEEVLVVWPRRGFTCDLPAADGGQHVGDRGQSRHRDGGGDLLGLRELLDDEDARRVHWKKSAGGGQLLTVEREREDRLQFTLRIDRGAGPEALERACEETAALGHLLLGRGHEVGLVAGDRRIRPSAGTGHERRLLTALAWLGFEATAVRR